MMRPGMMPMGGRPGGMGMMMNPAMMQEHMQLTSTADKKSLTPFGIRFWLGVSQTSGGRVYGSLR